MGLLDIMIRANFIKDQFKSLFQKVKTVLQHFCDLVPPEEERCTETKEERERREQEQ